ncbi:MAG: sigma-70 family RNA polymerase sigma factor [Planctomycetota bacterium]|jgi:RNA polymerase sigma factor (sigma-70 family)
MATDRQLIGWLKGRHPDSALSELLKRYGPMVRRTALRVTRDEHAAEDVCQAVFLLLVRKSESLKRARSPGGLLHRLAICAARDWLKSERRRRRREEEAARMKTAREKESPTALPAGFDQALAGLPSIYRDAVIARYLRGLSQAEAAEELGIKEGTLEARTSRALGRLRRRLAGSCPGLTVAALTTGLTAETAATKVLGAAEVSSITTAAFGGARTTVNVLANGLARGMFWAKVKVAAAAVLTLAVLGGGGGAAYRLAAGEAAAPKFPLNPKVAAMKDNTWLKLPTPEKHPMTRSSSPWMPYVPEAGVGILWGCSHSGYHNDVWTYDLARNLWVERLKTEPSAAKDPDVLKYKDGLLMTREERPLSYHQWGFMDYDPDRKVLWHLGGGWQGVYGVSHHYKKIGREVKQEGDPGKHKRLAAKGPHLWQYSPEENKWRVVYTEDPAKCRRHGGYIRYFPPMKKLVMTPKWVTPNEERENYKIYDPETNKWEWLKVTWKPLPGEEVARYWVYGHSAIVYDAKRKALVHVFSKGGVWLLDPVKKTMTQIIAKDKTLPSNLDGPVGAYVYDSVGERVLGIFATISTYGHAHEVMKKRGFRADRAGVWVLDVENKKWARQPEPSDGVIPPQNKMGSLHHFYDPVQNATFVFRGGYNRANGECWVYRFRRAKK